MLKIDCKNSTNKIIFDVKYYTFNYNDNDQEKISETLLKRPYDINLMILNFFFDNLVNYNWMHLLGYAIDNPIQGNDEEDNKKKRNILSDEYVKLILNDINTVGKNNLVVSYKIAKSYPVLKNLMETIEKYSETENRQFFETKLRSGVKYVLRFVNNNISCLRKNHTLVTPKFSNLASRMWHKKVWDTNDKKLKYIFPNSMIPQKRYKVNAIHPTMELLLNDDNFLLGINKPTNKLTATSSRLTIKENKVALNLIKSLKGLYKNFAG
jgi:hypothetical protein